MIDRPAPAKQPVDPDGDDQVEQLLQSALGRVDHRRLVERRVSEGTRKKRKGEREADELDGRCANGGKLVTSPRGERPRPGAAAQVDPVLVVLLFWGSSLVGEWAGQDARARENTHE